MFALADEVAAGVSKTRTVFLVTNIDFVLHVLQVRVRTGGCAWLARRVTAACCRASPSNRRTPRPSWSCEVRAPLLGCTRPRKA
jgi:hypothetical protein